MATRQGETEVLGEREREQFERDGFVVIDPELPEEAIDELLPYLEPKYRYEGESGVDEDDVFYGTGRNPRIMHAWKANDAVRAIAEAPKVLATLEGLYGRRPHCFQTLNFPVGTEQHAHADGMFFNSEPLGYMCGVWIAFEDIDMDNGPLVYYPGSHKIPIPRWGEEMPDHRDELPDYEAFMKARHAEYDDYCAALLERDDFVPRYGTIRKGQALIWSAHLVHGGSPQRDKARSRNSQVNHYYFEGTRHFRPMRTDGDHLVYYYPEWVREGFTPDESVSMRQVVEDALPQGARVLVVANGDDALLELGSRQASHFPADGGHLAHHDGERVELLENERASGAEYIVFPKSQHWWLETMYPELQEHLEHNHRGIVRDGNACAIYALA